MTWQDICVNLKHFSRPITSRICEKEILAIFPQYKKGSMPIVINEESLKNLFNNHADNTVSFASDFATFLEEVIAD
jgi:hypothetical protein